VVAWETTGACNLACVTCRAAADSERPGTGEPDTAAALRLIDAIAAVGRPLLILTGGEPLLRPDILELAAAATARGLRVVLSTNATLLDRRWVTQLRAAGVQALAISLDASTPEVNDRVRGMNGAFDRALRGAGCARKGGLPFQVNTTVTRDNVDCLEDMLNLAIDVGAAAWDVFMLIPTGRGSREDLITSDRHEDLLHWLAGRLQTAPIPIRVTCSPQFVRVLDQEGVRLPPGTRPPSGCLCGNGFCFISRSGDVFGCGYLPLSAGNVLETEFGEIYRHATLFQTLRRTRDLEGKCGRCGYDGRCSGCRARAYALTGRLMAADPTCAWDPRQHGDDIRTRNGGT